jgi:hypothetical protein
MPPHRLRWRDLIPGLVALTACVLAAMFVLVYARVGALRGDAFPLVVVGGTGQDLLQGTDVVLAGQPIGQVESVEFRPPSTDTTHRLAIRVRVYESARALLRTDSYAHITAGGSPLGASVLALTPGSPDGQPLEDGDTIAMRQRPGFGGIASELAAGARLGELTANVEAIATLLAGTRGTVGAMLHDGAATRQMGRLSQQGGAVAARLGSHEGTVGGVIGEGLPQRRLALAMARVDSIRRLLASSEGNLGRFRRDSTLLVAIDDVRNEVSILRALITTPSGTIGRAATDGAVAAQLDSMSAALGALSADVRRRPFRYLVF